MKTNTAVEILTIIAAIILLLIALMPAIANAAEVRPGNVQKIDATTVQFDLVLDATGVAAVSFDVRWTADTLKPISIKGSGSSMFAANIIEAGHAKCTAYTGALVSIEPGPLATVRMRADAMRGDFAVWIEKANAASPEADNVPIEVGSITRETKAAVPAGLTDAQTIDWAYRANRKLIVLHNLVMDWIDGTPPTAEEYAAMPDWAKAKLPVPPEPLTLDVDQVRDFFEEKFEAVHREKNDAILRIKEAATGDVDVAFSEVVR